MSLLPLLTVTATSEGMITSAPAGSASATVAKCPTLAQNHGWCQQSFYPVTSDGISYAGLCSPVGVYNASWTAFNPVYNSLGSVYNRGFLANAWQYPPDQNVNNNGYIVENIPLIFGPPGTYNLGNFGGANSVPYNESLAQYTGQAQTNPTYLWPGSDGAFCITSWDDDFGGSSFWFAVYEILTQQPRDSYPLFHLNMGIPNGSFETVLPCIASPEFGGQGQEYFLSTTVAGGTYYTRMSVTVGPNAEAHTGQLIISDSDFQNIYNANLNPGNTNTNGRFFTPIPGGYLFSSTAGNIGGYHVAFLIQNNFKNYIKLIVRPGDANATSDMSDGSFRAFIDPNGYVYGLGNSGATVSPTPYLTFGAPPFNLQGTAMLPLPCFGQCEGPPVRFS